MSARLTSNALPTEVAVLTVCIAPEISAQLFDEAGRMPWTIISSTFEVYISGTRRPYLNPQLNAARSCIAIVDFDVDPVQAVESTRYLRLIFGSRISVIALAESRDPELLLIAMRAGCVEFLRKPVDLHFYLETLERLDLQWSNPAASTTTSGSILTFLGAKGGVGTTTIAVHLAVYIAQFHKKRTLLIDHHPELGHVCIYLGIDGARYNYSEAVRSVGRLDSELLRGFVAKHPSGLEILSSPDLCGLSSPMDPESIASTLDFLAGEYDYIIIDSPSTIDSALAAVLEASTSIYLVATPEIGAIRDLSRYVDALMLTEGNTEKMQVVVNRISSRYAVNIEHIEKAINLPVAIRLANSYAELVRSTNLGEPITLNKKSEFTAQFVKWANTLVGSITPAATTKKASSLFAMFS